ncbi:MAG TPA: alkaline phosphatase family protein [Bryobacteraceae bacterium]|nr:alkaline phosphatase family protein [Bryobacteraceae bacterium]
MPLLRKILLLPLLLGALSAQTPGPISNGYALPNGWRITPIGKQLPTEDLILRLTLSPDRRTVVASHGGFNPHGLVLVDAKTDEVVQRIPMRSAWLGLAWNENGSKLYVSGGNSESRRNPAKGVISVFSYSESKLTQQPGSALADLDEKEIYWSGLAHHPRKPLLFAANRMVSNRPGYIAVFDTGSGKLAKRIPVEVSPYGLAFNSDASKLYVTNWSSNSISVIDTESLKVEATLKAGDNPNDILFDDRGLLYVSSASDNSVQIIDAKTHHTLQRVSVALHPQSPEGSTPNALALDAKNRMLFVANADNNSVAVVSVAEKGKGEVLGFLPSGWYPSALAIDPASSKLFVGNSKGLGGYSNVRGPHSPIKEGTEGNGSVKSLQKGSIQILSLSDLKAQLPAWTKQVYSNVPYNDALLTAAKAPSAPSIVPREVGAGSPIKHIIYIIKENRTYDQVFGDIQKGNGDPRLTIFGRKVTPNHHAIAEQFVLFDNLFCDGEVSVDGHSWSNSAIATDFNEKMWPAQYGGHSASSIQSAMIPAAGHVWDLARRKGLTYRSYGEYASRTSDGARMEARQGVDALWGHVAPNFKLPGMRDTDNVREFIREFDEYERNYDSTDAEKRLPNYIVMSLGEDHTQGTRPGVPTPVAAVANNDHAVGMLVERVSNSKYWPETAIFVIEDDAQDGPDHVDARRTIALVVSPYTKRKVVDSTLYTTSSMLRTMELLLGLPPMTQYDAAATPMYAAFETKADLTPYKALAPQVDVNAKNTALAWGAKESMEMDLDEYDEAPMFALNEIIWKSVKGAESEMPAPIHRFHFGKK